MKADIVKTMKILFCATMFCATSLFSQDADVLAKIARAQADAETVPIRAFELSMYYQGFGHEIIGALNDINEWGSNRTYNEIPKIENLSRRIEVRDPQKAFDYALKAVKGTVEHSGKNLANLYLQGIGVEKDEEKALSFLSYLSRPIDIQKLAYIGSGRCWGMYIFEPLYAHVYYYGIGTQADKEKADLILSTPNFFSAWRNFYTGYLTPKNYELAIRVLELSEEFWAADELVRIYSGEYLPEHADQAKADFWKIISKERKRAYFKKINREIYGRISELEGLKEKNWIQLAKLIIWRGTESAKFKDAVYNVDEEYKNSNFDTGKAIKALDEFGEIFKNPKSKPHLYALDGMIRKWGFFYMYLEDPKGPIFDILKEREKEARALLEKNQEEQN